MEQLRAVGYARVSTEEQAKGYGISYTAKSIEKHNIRKGWLHLETFKDEGLSGTLPWQDRPDAKRLMLLAQQTPRPFDVVTVHETRAIGRKDRTFYRWYWSLEDLGIAVAVVDKDIDTTTEEGRLALSDDAQDAFKEIAKIRKRTQNGVQEKAEDGGHVGGVAPFGYVIENQGKRGLSRLVIEPVAAETLRTAWRLIVVEKATCEQAAQKLNKAKRYGYAERPWSSASLRHALKKDVIQKGTREFRSVGSKMPTHAPVTIKLDRIFTELEIAQLNVALERTARPKRKVPESHILSGRIIGHCGSHYVGETRSDGRTCYLCTGKKCGCSQLDGNSVERAVWNKVREVVLDPDRLKAASESWTAVAESAPESHEKRLADLDGQIEELEASIDAMAPTAALQAARKGLRGTEAQEAVSKALKPLTDELERLDRLREEASAWQRDAAEAERRSKDLEALAALAGRHIARLSESEKAEVMDFLKLRVQILGPVPRKTRNDDTISAWFRERNRVVPNLTDDAWALVRPIFEQPSAGRTMADPRRALNALLLKARTGCPWLSLPDGMGHVAMKAWGRWTKSGRWDELMEALHDVPGVKPPEDGVTLPPLVVYGEIHSDLWIEEGRAGGADVLLRASKVPSISFRMNLAA